MTRSWRDYVADILTALDDIADFTRAMDYAAFASV